MLNFFTRNKLAKILAIVFAVGVWFYVAAGEARVDKFPGKIPISIRNIPADMAVVGGDREMEVVVKAPYGSWQGLSADDFLAYVDLAGFSPGHYSLDIQTKITDPNITVIEKNPAKFEISLEPVTSKKVPVSVKTIGKVADGFTLTETKVEPVEAEVSGAKSVIEKITNATALIHLEDESNNVSKQARLVALDSSDHEISDLKFNPDEVRASLSIIKASNTKTVGIKANISGDPATNYWVSKVVATPSVAVIYGNEEQLKTIDYLNTEKISIDGLTDTLTKTVSLDLPSGIKLIEGENSVKVIIYVSPELNTRTLPASLNFINGKGSSEDTVNVKVAGPLSRLNILSSNDISATIDLSGKSSGSYFIDRSQLNLPAGIDLVDYWPKNIKITVQ